MKTTVRILIYNVFFLLNFLKQSMYVLLLPSNVVLIAKNLFSISISPSVQFARKSSFLVVLGGGAGVDWWGLKIISQELERRQTADAKSVYVGI